MPDEATTQRSSAQPVERAENFSSVYANSIAFEASAWDLKIIFGQLDQSSGTAVVQQKVAVTIPWPQAKLALFWLRVQVEAAEASVKAKIPIRSDLLPADFPEPDQPEGDDTGEFRETYRKLREDFLATI